jgi:hypothetical protein
MNPYSRVAAIRRAFFPSDRNTVEVGGAQWNGTEEAI